MNSIVIYLEGGGDSAQQKAELRVGFDRLLRKQKEAACARRLKWRLVPCGGRDNACDAFKDAVRKGDGSTLVVLLVDSEELIPGEPAATEAESSEEAQKRMRRSAEDRRNHLASRDGWDLKDIEAEHIHLMVTCMETWIVADPDALAEFYKQGFRPAKLPQRHNLEEEPKTDLYAKFADATKATSKKSYSEKNNSKIKHASKLLAMVDPEKVAARCPRFKTFTDWLDRQIRDA